MHPVLPSPHVLWTLHTLVQHPKSNAKLGTCQRMRVSNSTSCGFLHKLVTNRLDSFASNLFCCITTQYPTTSSNSLDACKSHFKATFGGKIFVSLQGLCTIGMNANPPEETKVHHQLSSNRDGKNSKGHNTFVEL